MADSSLNDGAERNHEASPMQLQAARAQGKFAKSSELAASLSMLGALVCGYLSIAQIGHWLRTWTTGRWATAGTDLAMTPEQMTHQLQSLTFSLASVLLPFLLMLFFVAIAANWVQTGPVWQPRSVMPDLTRVGPKRWFGQLSIGRMCTASMMGLPKIGVGVAVMAFGIWTHRFDLMQLVDLPADQLVAQMFLLVVKISVYVVVVMTLVGLVDFGLKWASYRRGLRMTDQEVREESRMQEGDSINRSRQRPLNRV